MSPAEKKDLHPRNAHRLPYDFPLLIKNVPELAAFVRPGSSGGRTIDFADPLAVKILNQALLKAHYDIGWWDIPEGCLCPPVPGRADYIHHVADLLPSSLGAGGWQGSAVRVLDIGVGANLIYPIIGQHEYGWRFVGTDSSAEFLSAAQKIVDANSGLSDAIELRLQPNAQDIFAAIVAPDDYFQLTVCNPPFHTSAIAARDSHQKRRTKMGLASRPDAGLNFGGRNSELWCPGGELEFVRRMISQSTMFRSQVLWFTTLVSKRENLPFFYRALKQGAARQVRTMPLSTGQKVSRVLAWTFQDVPK